MRDSRRSMSISAGVLISRKVASMACAGTKLACGSSLRSAAKSPAGR
jgi:hypothetical protein